MSSNMSSDTRNKSYWTGSRIGVGQIDPGADISVFSATPSNAKQKYTIALATGGTFTITPKGVATAAIAWSAVNATLIANIQAAVNALPSVGLDHNGNPNALVTNLTLASGLGAFQLEFKNDLAQTYIALGSADATSLTSGTTATITPANVQNGGVALIGVRGQRNVSLSAKCSVTGKALTGRLIGFNNNGSALFATTTITLTSGAATYGTTGNKFMTNVVTTDIGPAEYVMFLVDGIDTSNWDIHYNAI